MTVFVDAVFVHAVFVNAVFVNAVLVASVIGDTVEGVKWTLWLEKSRQGFVTTYQIPHTAY